MLRISEEEQIKILRHWYCNWSEAERQIFLKSLRDKLNIVSSLANSLASLSVSDKTPTTFDCQLQRFSLWFDNWSFEGKNIFLNKLLEVDPQIHCLLLNKIN